VTVRNTSVSGGTNNINFVGAPFAYPLAGNTRNNYITGTGVTDMSVITTLT